jgi:pyridoxine 5-phosphate synthase
LACSDDVLNICCRWKPTWGLLVPESRQEVTTEGGLDVRGNLSVVSSAVKRLRDAGILVSLFLDPDLHQIEAAANLGVDAVELHTGPYAIAKTTESAKELQRLRVAGQHIHDAGMRLHAGHGLTYANVRAVASIEHMAELNIGHSIVSRSVMVGMTAAVSEMRRLLDSTR